MSFTYGGINTDDLEGVEVTPITYPNMGGLQLDTVPTPGRDGRFYGGSRMTTSQLPFRVTISGENQQQADLRRLAFMRMLDPSTGARSLRLDNTANWHYPQAVVAQQIEWEKHADRSKVMYDGEVMFETNFDAAMRQIDPSTVSGVGQIEFVADMGSTVSYPTIIFESGGDIRVRVNDFIVDLYDTPPGTYGVVNWDEYKFYTADPDVAQSIFYEWTGERPASESIKRVGGVEVARNLTHDPEFETNAHGWSVIGASVELTTSQPQMWGGRGGSMLQAAANSTSTFSARHPNIPIEQGQWFAWKLLGATEKTADLAQQFWFYGDSGRTGATTEAYHPAPWYDGTELLFVAQAPAGTIRVNPRVYMRPNEAGDRLWLDRVHTAVADSESDALAQVENYFDGDSIGHIVPGERISSLVNSMSHFERPAIYPGDSVEVEVTTLGSDTQLPVIVYPNHRRL